MTCAVPVATCGGAHRSGSYWFIAPAPCEWLAPLDQSIEPPAFRLALKSDDAEPIHVRGLGDLASLPASVRFIGSGLVPPPA